MPAAIKRQPAAARAVGAQQFHEIGIEGVAVTVAPGVADEAVLGDRRDKRRIARVVVALETLEGICVQRGIVAPAESLDEQVAGQGVFEVESVAAKVGIVGRSLDVESPAPSLVDIKQADTSDVAAGVAPADNLAEVSALLGPGDAAGDLELAAARPLAIFAGQHDAFVRGEDRCQGGVAVGREIKIIGNFEDESELGAGAERRGQEAAAAVDRGIGVRKVGRIGDGHAEEFEERVAVLDLLATLVVNDADRLDLPQR